MKNQHPTPRTVRFDVYHAGGFVRLAIKLGGHVTIQESKSTDEGWTCACVEYTYDIDEATQKPLVELRDSLESQDCDGRMDYYYTFVADPTDRYTYIDANSGNRILCLNWRKISSHQRDYTAEAMGY